MTDPVRASNSPYEIEVKVGESYFWCSCGQSQNQPFFDGSHKGSEFSPVKYEPVESKKVFFCGCKSTKSKPFCDGSHQKI